MLLRPRRLGEMSMRCDEGREEKHGVSNDRSTKPSLSPLHCVENWQEYRGKSRGNMYQAKWNLRKTKDCVTYTINMYFQNVSQESRRTDKKRQRKSQLILAVMLLNCGPITTCDLLIRLVLPSIQDGIFSSKRQQSQRAQRPEIRKAGVFVDRTWPHTPDSTRQHSS